MDEWKTTEIEIGEIDRLLKAGYEIEVDSPDGFVGVNFFIDKGMHPGYTLEIEGEKPVVCNGAHLFETTIGWAAAATILNQEVNILTRDGYKKGIVSLMDEEVPIVDINVQHDNHRYYTENVSSHNTGVGKSLFMCHVAAGALTQMKNVLYISMEMSEERVAERIDANLLNTTIDKLPKLSKANFDARISGLHIGKLVIKEYPTAAANVSHFKQLLSDLKLKKDFVPDLICVDYLNICSSSRMKSDSGSYTFVKAIAEELRGLAQEFNLPILSATQTTRGGYDNSDVGLTDTSESFGLPATADLMFALISTEEMETRNQIMIKQLKNRYNDPTGETKKFVVGIDRAKMRLYDVEASAQTLNIETTTPKSNEFSGIIV